MRGIRRLPVLAAVCCISTVGWLEAGEAAGTPDQSQLIEILNEALACEQADVQAAAARAYESLGPRGLPGLQALAQRLRKAATPGDAAPFARALLCLGDGLLPEVRRMAEAKDSQSLVVLVREASRWPGAPAVMKFLSEHPDPAVSQPVKHLVGTGAAGITLAHDSKTRRAVLQGSHGRIDERYREYLLAALSDPYGEIRAQSARALGGLKPPTPQTLEALNRMLLEDGEVPGSAAQGLSMLGAPALPFLLQALKSPDKRLRRIALDVMDDFGPEAAEALPVLREIAQKEMGRDRIDAIRDITCISGSHEEALTAYFDFLDHEAEIEELEKKWVARLKAGQMDRTPEDERASALREEREFAIRGLAKVGPPVADRVLPILRKAIFEAKPENERRLERFAEYCLLALPQFGSKGMWLLFEAVTSPKGALSLVAESVAWNAGKKHGVILLWFARQPDPKRQMVAAQQMFHLPNEQLTATATAVLQSTDRAVRLRGLRTLTNTYLPGVPGLGRAIAPLARDSDTEIQKFAAHILEQFPLKENEDPPAEEVNLDELAPRVDAALDLVRKGQYRDEDVTVLHDALRTGFVSDQDLSAVLAAFKNAGKKSSSLCATLLACARSPRRSFELRQAALDVVLGWEPAANRENLLLEWIASPDLESFYDVVACELVKCGPKVFPRVVQLARSTGPYDAAARCLANALSTAGAEAIPALVELLADPKTRSMAVCPLSMFGAAAVDKVRPLLNSTDEGCLLAVLQVLKTVQPSDPATAAALRQVCEKGPVRVRGEALNILAANYPGDPGIQKAVVDGLLFENPAWQAAAVKVTAQVTVNVEKAVTELSRCFAAARTPQEQQALLALLDSIGAQALPCLEAAVATKSAEVRERVWKCTAWGSTEALPVLARLLQSTESETRTDAALQLRRHMPLSVIPLRSALKSANPEIQKLAREELALYGSAGKAVLDGKL